MAHIKGYTTAEDIVKDLITQLCTGDLLDNTNNWTLINPDPDEDLSAALETITNKAVVKASTKILKQWVKRESQIISEGSITVNDTMASDAQIRVFVRDKKYNLHRDDNASELDIMEYKKTGDTAISVNTALNGKEVLVDYEKTVDITKEFYLKILKLDTVTIDENSEDNHYGLNWIIGEDYVIGDDTDDIDITLGFPVDHYSMTGKLNWFKETAAAVLIAQSWLPIEYWISFDKNALVGVVMGDPGLSNSEWLSSPFYFGSISQIEGALETDLDGNFGGFSGSFIEPSLEKTYGDYTGTGITDLIMTKTKTKRPYQAHKFSLFNGYEFREKTFNGQSLHTGKHPVSDIVVTDIYENDRGILQYCLAVPRVAKEHGAELIYNRYMSGKEQTYIFLNINAPYTPFNTGPDSLIGIAIRADI
jgi:hypothetical protein